MTFIEYLQQTNALDDAFEPWASLFQASCFAIAYAISDGIKWLWRHRQQPQRTIRNWNDSNGVTVYHKWENCWCGAHVMAEGSEAEVLLVCKQFRERHRHTQPRPRRQRTR